MNDTLPSPAAPSQPRLFQRLRWRLFGNTVGVMLRQAPSRLLTILFCSALIWGGLFAVSFEGFSYLRNTFNIPLDADIFQILFSLLFVSLTVLLIFSSAIILYSSLFTTPEAAFLLSTPAAADQVFAYKYQGAVAFSSWAFVLLGSPLLIAYGLVLGSPWYYYLLLPLFFVGFVLLPGSIGALLCLLIVNFMPQRRKQVLVLAGLAVLAAAGWWLYGLAMSARGHIGQRDLLDQLLGGFALFRSSLVPAYWMARGVQAAAVGDLAEVGYSLALVWANGLFLYVVTAWLAGKLYRRGYNRTATGGSLRRRYGGGWLDAGVSGLLGWLHPQTRLLVVKDFRTFRRDPAQWAQVVILMGLAVLYFTNIRRFYQQDIGRRFQNGIGLLNLTATAFMMCAYTGRFIYPLLSLEGRKFWILGLLPLQRDRLLWGKFAFSATGALLVAEFLVVLSGTMLDLPWVIVGVHVVTVAVLALGLSGLSVGLGASLPNFRESDPSKIAVGFGGTLNLVVGLLFLLVMIGVMAAPWHLYLAARADLDSSQVTFPAWLWLGVALGIGLGALAAVLPLQAGARALRKMEF